jgi:glycosyltransferase involved in cell wall biosynthesis
VLRVAHILLGRCNPDSANGVEKTIAYLSRAQASLGASVKIFSITPKEPIPIPGVEVSSIKPPYWIKFGSKLPLTFSKVIDALLSWKPDIVHFHSVHIGPFIGIARHLLAKSIPYVITPHGGYAYGRLVRAGHLVRLYLCYIERPYIENAFFIHAVSYNDIEGLRFLDIQPKKIVLAPNGLDLSEVPKEIENGLLRKKYQIPKSKRIFLFLGRLDPNHKGLDLLLEGFARAHPQNAVLVLAGPDWRGSLQHLRFLVQKLGIEKQVIFTGPIYGTEKWAFLKDADVFVHTSRWEAGVPFAVLEAMATGKPCLLSHVADPMGLIGKACAGRVVELNAESIAKEISTLAEVDINELYEMGKRAQTLIARDFNWQGIARTLIEAYEGKFYE